jgi:hypothetical protein
MPSGGGENTASSCKEGRIQKNGGLVLSLMRKALFRKMVGLLLSLKLKA